MSRNLDRRVETLFPVEDARLRRYLRDTVLDLYLRDNTQARELQPDGQYLRVTPGDEPPVNAQRALLVYEQHAGQSAKPRGARHRMW
jgi:polyphosphate kinase